MQIFFNCDKKYDVYKRDYYPLLLRHGFSWRLFPELKIYLDMDYPDRQDDHISKNLEHYRPDVPLIYAKMMTLDDWLAVGNDEASYWRAVETLPSSLPHEIMHHIHYKYFGEDDSLIWRKAAALTGLNLDFRPHKKGEYHYKPAYEAVANYFEDCIEGRASNEPFLQFIRDLIGIKYVVLTIDKRTYQANGETKTLDVPPVIKDGRTLIPVRATHAAFNHDVQYLDGTKEVVIATY